MGPSARRKNSEMAGVSRLSHSNARFALDLYRQLCTAKGNLFFSPFSISTVLAMTYAGARGDTARQMRQTLHFDMEGNLLHPAFSRLQEVLREVEQRGGIQLKTASALWPHLDYPVLQEYLALVQEAYSVRITGLDYRKPEQARHEINDWVADKTGRKITDLIPPGLLNALTRLVLTNAIYFKGDWAVQFNPQNTADAPFWTAPGASVSIPLMTHEAEFGYAAAQGVQIIQLPYVGGDLSMIVLLPDEVSGLAKVEQALTPVNLERWISLLRERLVQVSLPRIRLTGKFNLNEVLQSLGMVDAFSEEKADFSGIDGVGWLFISAVLHKAFLEVNEEGSEAAAASAVVMDFRSAPVQSVVFRADHPFIFMIYHKSSDSILFMGRVVEPNLTD